MASETVLSPVTSLVVASRYSLTHSLPHALTHSRIHATHAPTHPFLRLLLRCCLYSLIHASFRPSALSALLVVHSFIRELSQSACPCVFLLESQLLSRSISPLPYQDNKHPTHLVLFDLFSDHCWIFTVTSCGDFAPCFLDPHDINFNLMFPWRHNSCTTTEKR